MHISILCLEPKIRNGIQNYAGTDMCRINMKNDTVIGMVFRTFALYYSNTKIRQELSSHVSHDYALQKHQYLTYSKQNDICSFRRNIVKLWPFGHRSMPVFDLALLFGIRRLCCAACAT